MSIPYDPEHITYFAETDFRNQKTRFGIKSRDRTRHMYVIGKSGVGKSTLLENMAIQDIQNGEGIAVLDPHGSFADKMLDYVPAHRIKDVVYFAPFDTDHPISFNVLEDVGADKRHFVVSGLMSTFKKIWVDAWSARMEYILTNTLLALLEYPGATLLGVNRMLSDKEFRTKVVNNISDMSVKAFWVEEFAKYTERMAAEAVPAIQNKIGQFTANPLVRNIIGQPKSSFDIRKVMDEQKILIINLSKGRIGDTNTSLLGSMLITKIYLSAMSRAEVSAGLVGALPNFYFYVDEFQSFANETFADILAEARKYKLALIIAHQYVAQMEEKVRDAVFGNVGTTVSFRVGPLDAELLEKVFAPQFNQNDLINLGMAQIYLSLMINDIGSPSFSARTLPPIPRPTITYRNDIIESSRAIFAAPRDKVETDTREWYGKDAQGNSTSTQSDDAKPRPPFKQTGASHPYQPRETPPIKEQPFKKAFSAVQSQPVSRTPSHFPKPAPVSAPFKKPLSGAFTPPRASTPAPITPEPIVDDTLPDDVSPGLKSLISSLSFEPTVAPVQKIEPVWETKEEIRAQLGGTKPIAPVKIAQRGPTEKSRDLLKAALAGALKDTPKQMTPPPTPVQPQPAAPVPPPLQPAEVSHQTLQKILE